jgi:hypothetical protein
VVLFVSRALVACFVLVASTANAQDMKQLVGVAPGEMMPEVEASVSNANEGQADRSRHFVQGKSRKFLRAND